MQYKRQIYLSTKFRRRKNCQTKLLHIASCYRWFLEKQSPEQWHLMSELKKATQNILVGKSGSFMYELKWKKALNIKAGQDVLIFNRPGVAGAVL